ncbi:MAG: asparaginase domain-containing protein [Acutalibacteraceae bacterium]|nr:asparaginase domain-containing protein [Acutalibacteraceae bacterium]
MSILVVFTGGTIGSEIINGVADVSQNVSNSLLSGIKAGFECVSPFSILSENSTPETLSKLCNFMLSVPFEKYDGVVITHGSDTLAYSSAVLGLALSWVNAPVVITAADSVLSMPASNGKKNFSAAVNFILDFKRKNHTNTGVFTVWQNKGEMPAVYLSTRLNEADGFTDSFSSWGGVPFGYMNGERFERVCDTVNPPCTVPQSTLSFLKGASLNLSPDICMIDSYVGLDFSSLCIRDKRAVLLRLYHSATACTIGEKLSVDRLIEQCNEYDTDIYVYPAKQKVYEYSSEEVFRNSSVRRLYSIGKCAAYSKLMLAYAFDGKKRETILNNNIFYEIIDSQ